MPCAFPYDTVPDRASRRFAAVLLVMVTFPSSLWAQPAVPLPRPKPPRIAPSQVVPPEKRPNPETAAKPAEPPPPSACRLALSEDVAIAPSLPPIEGPGSCGGTDLVRLEAVVLPDKTRVPLKPAATLRCEMASAVAQWVRADMVPLAAQLGTPLREMDNFDSYDCRGRNRIAGAKISEHGKANAIDVRGFRLGDGRMLSFTDRAIAIEARNAIKASVCARFTTVLGPGSDGYHEDHIHFDLAQRRGGYRLCQWEMFEPLPAMVPLPPEKPAMSREDESDEKASEEKR